MTNRTKRKTGRPPRNDVDRCQTIYWALKVQGMTGLTFAEIERILDPDCAVVREDKGGYMQPQLWRKYGAGLISPIGNGRSNKTKPTAVDLAERIAPGANTAYNSVLWSILRSRKILISAGKLYCTKIDAQVIQALKANSLPAQPLWANVLKLNSQAIAELESIAHIDVMAIFLLHLKCAPWPNHRNIVGASHRWMSMMAECDHAFSVIVPKFKAVLKDYDRWFRPALIYMDTLHLASEIKEARQKNPTNFLKYLREI